MDDRQIEIIAEHLMSGQRISVYDVQRHFKLNKGQATELLNLAQNKVEDNKNSRQTQKQVEVAVKSKLAPQVSVATTMLLGRDMDTGMTALAELKSGVPGQTYFDPDDSIQKTDTGKPIDEVEAESESKESKGNVIDLQNQG